MKRAKPAKCPTHADFSGTTEEGQPRCESGEGTLLAVVTAEERAAIHQLLKESAAPGGRVGRATVLARAALKIAGMLLLGASVLNGYADGNEFNEVGCSVAQQPGGTSHGARSARSREERAGSKLPGAEGGSAGGSGGSAGTGPPQCEVRAAECPNRMADGHCPLLEVRNAELGVRNGTVAESLPARLWQQLLAATPEKLAEVERVLARGPLPDTAQASAECGVRSAELKGGPNHVFRWTGRDWKVVWAGGNPFYLQDMLAAKCADYLLHHPNDPISSFDLEVRVQPEKGAARARNSIQADSDARALLEYRQELQRLKAEKRLRCAEWGMRNAEGEQEGRERLESEIAALESALKERGGPADTGERAYDNVRKTFGVLRERLRQGGPEERAFAEHLRTHLSIGLECLYSQDEGRIWG